MKDHTSETQIALVTVPNRETAERLAHACLTQHLVACANIIPGVESMYWWKGKIESDQELLILFKTSTQNLASLKSLILQEHPYDVPEFIHIPIQGGSSDYLGWILTECTTPDPG